MATKLATNSQQSFTLGDTNFVGIDTYTSPNKLNEGYFQVLDNVSIYGNALQPRNGWKTCWHSTATINAFLPAPIWETVSLKDSGHKSKIVFTCNSKLYYWDPETYGNTNNGPIELIDRNTGASFSFPSSELVRMVSYGKYIYGAAGGSHPLFRVRMNGAILEAESLPVLDDITSVIPIATAYPITVQTVNPANKSNIDINSFGGAPFNTTNLITNPKFTSATATGFGEWNYNTGDAQRITGVTHQPGGTGPTYYVYSKTAKNRDNFIMTRGNALEYCIKVDHPQDYITQDINIANNVITKDEVPLVITGNNGSPTLTVTNGHGLAVGQIIRFTATIAGLTSGINYYIKTVSGATLTVTTDPTLTAAATSLSANLLAGQTYLVPQHNAGLYCLTFYAFNSDDLTNFVSNNTLDVNITGFWKSGTTAFTNAQMIDGAQVYYNAQPAAGTSSADWQKFQVLIDFREFDKILTGIQIRVQSAFNRGGDSFVYLSDFYLHALNSRFQVPAIQDDPKNLVKIVANQANSTFITDTNPDDPFVSFVEDEYIKINISNPVNFTASINTTTLTSVAHGLQVGNSILFSSTTGGVSTSSVYYVKTVTTDTFQITTDSTLVADAFIFTASVTSGANTYTYAHDLRKVESISVRANLSEKLNQSVPPFSLGVRYNNVMYFTGQCSYDKENSYLTFQLFPLEANTRSAVTAIYIKNDYDLVEFTNNEWVISIGDVVKQGLLTPGSKYTYSFSLWRPYTLPISNNWTTPVNFTAALNGQTLTTSTAHYLSAGQSLMFSTTVGGVVTTTTYYVKSILSATTFQVTADSTLQAASYTFTAAVTLGSNQYIVNAELPNDDGFETNPSKLSNTVITTAAINSVTLNIPLTALQLKQGLSGSVSKYKYCLIYRSNVLTGDNRQRLIGLIDLDSNTVYSSGTKWVGLKSTSDTNVTVIDQVADSQLYYDNGPGTVGFRQKTGRDQYPVGCDSLAVFNQRLFASKKNTVYASWLLTPNNEYSLYTTYIPFPDDPEVSIKGTSFSISHPTDTEQIQAMATVQGDGMVRDNSTSAVLVIMREHSTYLLTGDSPHNFFSQGFLQQSGSGLLAKRGYAVVAGRLNYLTANGIVELQNTVLFPKGLQLEGILNIRSADYASGSSNVISASAYAKTVMCAYDRKLLVLAPSITDTSSTTCTTLFTYDTRNQGWVRWKTPYSNGAGTYPNNVQFTSLVTLESADDLQELYAGARDGKLYKLEGYVDSVYNNSGSIARTDYSIPWRIQTRKYGQTFAEGTMYYSANKIHALLLHIDNQSTNSLNLTWGLTGMKGYTNGNVYNWPPSTQKVLSLRSISRTSDQQAFDITVSGSSTDKWKMFAINAQTTEGNTPRQ